VVDVGALHEEQEPSIYRCGNPEPSPLTMMETFEIALLALTVLKSGSAEGLFPAPLIGLLVSGMSQPYNYVRFRWWTPVDLEKVYEELKGDYVVGKKEWPSSEMEVSLFKDERVELSVVADTLHATLSPFRAILSQGKAAPFTQRDVKLRDKVVELYPRNRPSPFPWEFSVEPKFEVEGEAK